VTAVAQSKVTENGVITMRMSRGYIGGVSDGGSAAGESTGGILSFMSTLPPWLSAIITIAALILLAWIAGIIVGKIYAGIRYPDPGKPSIFSAKQKVLFLGVAVAVIFLLFTTLSKSNDPSGGMLPSDEPTTGDYTGGDKPIDGGGIVIKG